MSVYVSAPPEAERPLPTPANACRYGSVHEANVRWASRRLFSARGAIGFGSYQLCIEPPPANPLRLGLCWELSLSWLTGPPSAAPNDEAAAVLLWRACGPAVECNNPAAGFRFARAGLASVMLVGLDGEAGSTTCPCAIDPAPRGQAQHGRC